MTPAPGNQNPWKSFKPTRDRLPEDRPWDTVLAWCGGLTLGFVGGAACGWLLMLHSLRYGDSTGNLEAIQPYWLLGGGILGMLIVAGYLVQAAVATRSGREDNEGSEES